MKTDDAACISQRNKMCTYHFVYKCRGISTCKFKKSVAWKVVSMLTDNFYGEELTNWQVFMFTTYKKKYLFFFPILKRYIVH